MAQKFTRNLLWSPVLIFAVLFPIFRQTQWHAVLDLPIGKTAFRDVEVYREFQWLAQRTHPSEFFFNNSALCLYLSLDNPTVSEFLPYAETTRPEQADSILQSLQRHPPQFIVLLPESGDFPSVHDHAAPLWRFVHDNYHLVKMFYLQDGQDQQQLWEREP
jgi:hypothetical protein